MESYTSNKSSALDSHILDRESTSTLQHTYNTYLILLSDIIFLISYLKQNQNYKYKQLVFVCSGAQYKKMSLDVTSSFTVAIFCTAFQKILSNNLCGKSQLYPQQTRRETPVDNSRKISLLPAEQGDVSKGSQRVSRQLRISTHKDGIVWKCRRETRYVHPETSRRLDANAAVLLPQRTHNYFH